MDFNPKATRKGKIKLWNHVPNCHWSSKPIVWWSTLKILERKCNGKKWLHSSNQLDRESEVCRTLLSPTNGTVPCVGRGHMRFKEKVKGIGRGTFWIFSLEQNILSLIIIWNYSRYIHLEHNNTIRDIYI